MSKVVDELVEKLKQTKPTGAEANLISIVHGDFRLDNLIFHPKQNRVVAVLDWELATLGHPLVDLAYNCMFYKLPPSSVVPGISGLDIAKLGLPSQEEYIGAYARGTRREGPISSYPFYSALSLFRMAAIAQVGGTKIRVSTHPHLEKTGSGEAILAGQF